MKNWNVPDEVWELVVRMGEENEREAGDAALICLLNGLGYTAAITSTSEDLRRAIGQLVLNRAEPGQLENHELEIMREPRRN